MTPADRAGQRARWAKARAALAAQQRRDRHKPTRTTNVGPGMIRRLPRAQGK